MVILKFLRSLTNETRELARQTSVTLFSALFAAFQIAFYEWSGVDDLVVGTPVANRTRQSARDTMGYYSGIVPLRWQTDPSRIAADHLRAGHQQTIDSFANAIPFVELARSSRGTIHTGVQSGVRSSIRIAESSDAGDFAAESFRASEHAFDRHPAFPARDAKSPRPTMVWKSPGSFVRTCFPGVTFKISMAYFSEFWRASAARRRAESPNLMNRPQ
jgi:non-ribosomal peptide synthetase component F